MSRRIVCLPGDGIGPEVMAEAVRVLEALPLELEIERAPLRRRRDRRVRRPAAAETLAACRAADAVLLGAVGGPKWDGGAVRPEAGLIGLRKELDVYANLRPAVGDGHRPADRARAGRRPLLRRARRARGRRRLRHLRVPPDQVERIARRAFELARGRVGPAALGRQGERARDVAHVAARRHRARRPSTPTSSCATGSSTASRCSSSWTRPRSTCS